jgi:hypothetical protein
MHIRMRILPYPHMRMVAAGVTVGNYYPFPAFSPLDATYLKSM